MGYGSSGASVVSFSTAKSSGQSIFSRKSNRATHDAIILSQATGQAIEAAKAILHAGGSEVTALKTAKAAAVSALMPDSSAENDIGSSFLRRRKLKRQAEVVASMALASAMAGEDGGSSTVADWEGSSLESLRGVKYANPGPPTKEAKDMKVSSTQSEERHGKPKTSRRKTTAEMISRHLKMIPSLSATFTGSTNNSGSGDAESAYGIPQSESCGGDRSMERQLSTFTDSTNGDYSTYSTDQYHMAPRYRHHYGMRRHHNDKWNSGCLNNTLSYADDDETVYSDADVLGSGNPVDNMIFSIMNAFNCGPKTPVKRPREIRVPSRSMECIDEEEDYYEETIIFDNIEVPVNPSAQPTIHVDESNEEKEEEDHEEIKELSNKLEQIAGEKKGEEKKEEAAEYDAPFMSVSASTTMGESASCNGAKTNDVAEAPRVSNSASTMGDSLCTNGTSGEDILMDLMASKKPSESEDAPLDVATDKKKAEVHPAKRDSLDELTMVLDGLVSLSVEHNEEDINYVQIVSPHRRRNRRMPRQLSRQYNQLGDETPAQSPEHGDAPGTSPSAKSPIKSGMARLKKNLWAAPKTPKKAGMALLRKNKWRKTVV